MRIKRKMLKILLYILALFACCESEEVKKLRRRRGSFHSTFPIGEDQLQIGGVDVESYGKPSVDLHDTDLYSHGVVHAAFLGDFLPIPEYTQPDVNLKVDLTEPMLHLQDIRYATSNALDKPVYEIQEYVPPQPMVRAIIPVVPPPARPVNAVAANVPNSGGAVFLGSGSLGVIDLGGGAYAIGSGSLGYSERRSNPRGSAMAPLLPPLQAAPNLLPAAVNTSSPPQIPVMSFEFSTGSQLPINQYGYEYLPPNRVGFGDPLPPRPLKTTNAFATPTALQIQSPPPIFPPQPLAQLPPLHQLVPQPAPLPQLLLEPEPQTAPLSVPQLATQPQTPQPIVPVQPQSRNLPQNQQFILQQPTFGRRLVIPNLYASMHYIK